jgi:beta-carotene hydroxylase
MIAMRDFIPLRYLADWRSVFTVAATILVISVQWNGVFRHPLLWCTSVLLIYACFLVNHNHQHLPVFTRPWLNHFFDLMLTVSTGLRASLLIPLHNRNHHDARNGPGDYMTTAILRWKNPVLRMFLYPFAAAVAYAPQKAALIRAIAHEEPWLQRRLLAQRVVLWLMLGVMLVLRPLDTVVSVSLLGHKCQFNSTRWL